jgi:hypothetical protein
MANQMGNAYALTLLCPIRHGVPQEFPPGMEGQTCAACVRYLLQDVMRVSEDSPMARVPNTYLSRFYILEDVPYQGKPAVLEHLKSNYLVFSANLHGDLDMWLTGMWNAIQAEIRDLLQYCFGFETVRDSASFITWIKKCQVETTFFFDGSTDEALAVQLKNLYLKQEFSDFVFANQGNSPEVLQANFREFVARTQPGNIDAPTWKPGAYSLDDVVAGLKAKGAGSQ